MYPNEDYVLLCDGRDRNAPEPGMELTAMLMLTRILSVSRENSQFAVDCAYSRVLLLPANSTTLCKPSARRPLAFSNPRKLAHKSAGG